MGSKCIFNVFLCLCPDYTESSTTASYRWLMKLKLNGIQPVKPSFKPQTMVLLQKKTMKIIGFRDDFKLKIYNKDSVKKTLRNNITTICYLIRETNL